MQPADQLRAAGVAVFPCWARYNEQRGRWDKGPAVPQGVSWLTVALNPQDYPALNWSSGVLGLPIPNGVVVLDLDLYKGVTRAAVEQFLGCALPWDAACIQRTIGGGEHYAFRCSWPVRQGDSIGMPGLDTRAAGRGFICSGEGYTPVNFGAFAFSNVSALPELPDAARPALERRDDTPAPPPVQETATRDDEQVAEALRHIDPGCSRSEWRDVGFALKALYQDDDPAGYWLFEQWSAGEFWPDGAPDNYVLDGKGSVADQWPTFKADGMVRPATLFYKAIQAGWRPPAGFDTAGAFGQGAAELDVFEGLVVRVRESGGDVLQVPSIVDEIQAAGCSALQVALLAAELKTALRDAGIRDNQLGKVVDTLLGAGPSPMQHEGATPEPGQFLNSDTPLHPSAWAPMQTKGKSLTPKGTLRNFEIMLQTYGVTIEFDEVRKTLRMRGPGMPGQGVLHEEAVLAYLDSLANLNEYPVNSVRTMIMPVANQHTVNPVRDWVESSPWDGTDHVGALWSQIQLAPDEDAEFCETLFRKWLRGAYGIGTGHLDRWEFAIVLIDPNGGAGKTRFFSTLCPAELQTDSVILDPGNKDSVKLAISYWLTELGELDGTFNRSDLARIKAFMSLRRDEMRLPYGRAYLEYPRRTALWASVNETHFLVDPSDNRRFWGMQVHYANHQHGVNSQQVWAQAAAEFHAGAEAHLTPQENQILVGRNEMFRTGSAVADAIGRLDLSPGEGAETLRSVSEILALAGVGRPTKADLNEAARLLRRRNLQEGRRGGRRGFFVTIEEPNASAFKPAVVGGGQGA